MTCPNPCPCPYHQSERERKAAYARKNRKPDRRIRAAYMREYRARKKAEREAKSPPP